MKCDTCKQNTEVIFIYKDGDRNCGDCYFIRCRFHGIVNKIFPYT